MTWRDLVPQFLALFTQAELQAKIRARVVALENGCWEWIGYRRSSGGAYPFIYGDLTLARGNMQLKMRAHRLSFLAFKGTIPPGHDIDHLCRVTVCVNPDHLEAVTRRENLLRGVGISAQHAAKTACPQGHPYDGFRNGGRRCSICDRATEKRRVRAIS